MQATRLPLSLALLVSIAGALPACERAPAPEAPEAPEASDTPAPQTAAAADMPRPPAAIREIPVTEASAMFTAGTAAPVDANSPRTRESRGTVPGATLLSGGAYALSELPDNDLLVFYCANTSCSASDRAAERARDAGRRVAVMREGIAGWIEAGQPVARPGAGADAEAAPPAEEPG